VFGETNLEKRASIKKEIIRLSNLLDSKFATELNFRNHCYLRIAYDNTVSNKWDTVIAKPFIKNADEQQLNNAVLLLSKYVTDKEILLKHNASSLAFRKIQKL
jgi:hypothetical protein